MDEATEVTANRAAKRKIDEIQDDQPDRYLIAI
jgi:hypothetical protein